MGKKNRVLIIEDNLISSEYLRVMLEDEGYEVVDVLNTGQQAIRKAAEYKPDIILMDIMLKDNISGAEAAVTIHQKIPDCKIIFLTAYAEDEMIEYADLSNAYAYLLKPYREKEILATVKLASSHTTEKPLTPEIVHLTHGYEYHKNLHRLYKDNQEVPLSKNALKFIEILINNINNSVSNQTISYYIWGKDQSDNTIRSLLHRIRETVDNDLIHNVKGLGYIIFSREK